MKKTLFIQKKTQPITIRSSNHAQTGINTASQYQLLIHFRTFLQDCSEERLLPLLPRLTLYWTPPGLFYLTALKRDSLLEDPFK